MIGLRLRGRTYQYIAGKAGVSRQRIQQIISPPKHIRDLVIERYNRHCDSCGIYVGVGGHIHHRDSNGEEDYNDTENLQLLCVSCHLRKHSKPPQYQCRNCMKPIRQGIFCGNACFSQYHTVTLICSICSKPYSTTTSKAHARITRNKSGFMYCSKKCYGVWFGKNYGRRKIPGDTKWDYEKIYKARDETGFGAVRLSRLLKIPQGTISVILWKRRKLKTL